MSDLISRQAAIDALNKMKIYRPLDSDRYVISDCLNKIVNLPSAQPEHLVKKTGNLVKGLVNDCISRKASIEAVHKEFDECLVWDESGKHTADEVERVLADVPSAVVGTQMSLADCISRQAAIDALDALCDRECEYSKQQRGFMCGACRLGSAFDVIDELPSVQPQRWIPVTEALPKNGHYYLKCTKYGNVDVDYYWDGFENATKYGEEIVAWMEKPKPYKEGQDG